MSQELLILERVSDKLVPVPSHDGDASIVLEGTFGEIGIKNKNNRIYTEDQYLPQIEALQTKIEKFKLLGELDHPKQFDVMLSNASHVIEKLSYDKNSKIITGRIRLLNTPKGLTAQALIRDGIPLHISSRAAGSVNEQGMVTMKKLFTYDLVADPGFENAELKKVNELYGFDSEGSILIYEMNSYENTGLISDENDDKYKNTNIQMEQENQTPNFVTQEDFTKYSNYVKSTLTEIKESINNNFDPTKFTQYVNELTKRTNVLLKYVNYLAEELDTEIEYKDEIVENMSNLKKYSNYLAKTLDKNITENEDIKTTLLTIDESVSSLEEDLNYNTDYTKYLAKEVDKGLQYTEDVVAKKADEGLQYAEYLAGLINENIKDGNLIKEELTNIIDHNDYIVEGMDKLASHNTLLGNKINEMVDTINENVTGNNTDNGKPIEESVVSNTSSVSDYQKSINEKLQTIIQSAKKQKAETEDYRFLTLMEANYRNEFMGLSPEKKSEVMKALSDTGYKTKEDVKKIYEGIIYPEVKRLNFIENMPENIKPLWENLSIEGKKRIEAQAQYHKLDTQYQINNFWQTRDLRSERVQLKPINENEVIVENKKPLVDNSYMENFEQEMKRRFRR